MLIVDFPIVVESTILYACHGNHIGLAKLVQGYRLSTDDGQYLSTKTEGKKSIKLKVNEIVLQVIVQLLFILWNFFVKFLLILALSYFCLNWCYLQFGTNYLAVLEIFQPLFICDLFQFPFCVRISASLVFCFSFTWMCLVQKNVRWYISSSEGLDISCNWFCYLQVFFFFLIANRF